MTLSEFTALDQIGLGSNGKQIVFRITQSSNITGTSSSECLVSYPGHLLVVVGGSYMLPLYSTAPTDSAENTYEYLRKRMNWHSHAHSRTYTYLLLLNQSYVSIYLFLSAYIYIYIYIYIYMCVCVCRFM